MERESPCSLIHQGVHQGVKSDQNPSRSPFGILANPFVDPTGTQGVDKTGCWFIKFGLTQINDVRSCPYNHLLSHTAFCRFTQPPNVPKKEYHWSTTFPSPSTQEPNCSSHPPLYTSFVRVSPLPKSSTYSNMNSYDSSTVPARAVAALIAGDKTSSYNCSFIGIQDTLSDLFGRHYFNDCYIEGAVDFIFGLAQSLYEDCTLSTVPSKASAGWVTAHGRASPNDPSAFVFKNCKLTGSAKTYLGRAWAPYSRVIFYQTDMSDIVVPAGWNFWHDPSKGAYTTYVESSCTGAGSDTSKRVKWEKKLGGDELNQLTSISFVDDGWLSQQAW